MTRRSVAQFLVFLPADSQAKDKQTRQTLAPQQGRKSSPFSLSLFSLVSGERRGIEGYVECF